MSPDLTSHHGHACPLAIAEAALVRRVGRPRSLSPERQGATLPTCVASEVLTPRHDVAIGDALRAGVANLVQAQLVAFPGNLFWDIDCLVASVLREAEQSEEDTASFLTQAFAQMSALQHLFGQATLIRFRYIHDFIYGYDWARWVQEGPEERRGVGPYDRVFVERMHRRGHELLALIAENDGKYPKISDVEDRNPFGFSREPEEEMQLHRLLARDGSVPVRAWLTSPASLPDMDHSLRRQQLARRLGFSRP